VIAAVDQMKLTADIQHVKSMYEIAHHGVLPTPVLTINGEIKAKGRLLPQAEIKQMLRDATTGL
jgi:hypothetical protein